MFVFRRQCLGQTQHTRLGSRISTHALDRFAGRSRANVHNHATLLVLELGQYGVLGIFRPKTTKKAVAPAIRSLPKGITFSEVHIYTDFG